MKTHNIVTFLNIIGWIGIGMSVLTFFLVGGDVAFSLICSFSVLVGSVILFAVADGIDSLQTIANNTYLMCKDEEKMAK